MGKSQPQKQQPADVKHWGVFFLCITMVWAVVELISQGWQVAGTVGLILMGCVCICCFLVLPHMLCFVGYTLNLGWRLHLISSTLGGDWTELRHPKASDVGTVLVSLYGLCALSWRRLGGAAGIV